MKNFGSTSGLTVLDESPTTPANGTVTYITSDYNTGWMVGDIKGAFLADTDDTNLVGGTDADRSVNANALTVNGTVTRTSVATGADLVAYSGFSASNYLEQSYNPDFDFGTGDFCIMFWVIGGNADEVIAQSGQNRDLKIYTTGPDGRVIIGIVGGSITSLSPVIGGPTFVAFKREDGRGEIYINGRYETYTGTMSGDSVSMSEGLQIGNRNIFAGESSAPFSGSLSLFRMSATAPSAEQIAKIYNDEKHLFKENAQVTLYGSSNIVTALGHDPVTGLLHVGTSEGRSVFQGLQRVDNTTTAVTTAISAHNGLVVEQ